MRALPPRRRPAPGAARPELRRRRPLRDRRARAATGSSRSSPAPTRGATTPTPGGPQHIHFSVFGRAFTQRLVTQMYFPGDPLFEYDPIFNSVRDPQARERMVCALRPDGHQARLGARLPLRHRAARAARRPRSSEPADDAVADRRAVLLDRAAVARRPGGRPRRAPRARSGCAGACSTARGEPIPDALIETWQADPDGRYETPGFRGFGRCADRRRRRAGRSAPSSRARPAGRRRTSPSRCSRAGCCSRVVTRIYFADEEAANAADPVLAGLDEAARAHARGRPGGGRLPFRRAPPRSR